jgi:hypothetical protein
MHLRALGSSQIFKTTPNPEVFPAHGNPGTAVEGIFENLTDCNEQTVKNRL